MVRRGGRIGLQEKYSIAVLGFSIVVGALTGQRRVFLNKWIWIGGVAAFLIFLPNVIWNIAHDWPFVQTHAQHQANGRDVVLTPWQYFAQQILSSPFNAVLWITGVIAMLLAPRFRPYRFWMAYLVGHRLFVALKERRTPRANLSVYLAAGAIVINEAVDRIRSRG